MNPVVFDKVLDETTSGAPIGNEHLVKLAIRAFEFTGEKN